MGKQVINVSLPAQRGKTPVQLLQHAIGDFATLVLNKRWTLDDYMGIYATCGGATTELGHDAH